MAFGLVQLGLVAAHLQEAEKAGQLVNWLSSKYWSSGFGSFHNVGELFNTDISGGLPALIIEMLAQSEPGKLLVLPALPSGWTKGQIEGVTLRGQLNLDQLSWDEDEAQLSLSSAADQQLELQFHRPIRSITGTKLEKKDDRHFILKLRSGKPVSLRVLFN